MTELPQPPTPADCDLRDFAFMPLDVVRLRDSDLAATETAEVFRAAVMLWCASWHQLPAASLPDDDRVLANLAGYGRVVKAWQAERAGALRGWLKCADGRLYHPVVAEKAVEAWKGKLERQWRTEAARIKKHNQRHGLALEPMDFDLWLQAGRPQGQALTVPEDKANMSPGTTNGRPASVPGEKASKGQGERKGQGQGQGQGQVKRKGAKAPKSAANLPTWMSAVIDLWHEVLPELPGVVVMNAEREQALRDFRDWVFENPRRDGTPRATNEAEFLEWTRSYLGRARNNDFIMGRTPRSPEHQNWKAGIEWVLSSKGMQKIMEQTRAEEATA